MGKGKLLLFFLTILFLGLSLFAWTQRTEDLLPQEDPAVFSVQVDSGAGTETIHCWQRSDGNFYVFLPSYAQLSLTRIAFTDDDVLVNGIPLTAGMGCDAFQTDTPYSLEWGSEQFTLTFVHSANIASLHIDTASGNLDHIHALKGNEESGKLRLYDENGNLAHGGSVAALSGRGNSTWGREKKPYNLKLSAQADLLGMGSAQKWALYANYTDWSHMRNVIVYNFADSVGLAYSPQIRWTDLYINGDYMGLYQLGEKNELHPQRVNEPAESSFLVSMEVLWRLEAQEYPHFVTQSNMAIRVHHGTPEGLRDRFQAVENAIFSDDGIDPVTGQHYLDLIDLDSWVRKYLVEEILGNGDAGALSQFFYGSTAGGKVYAGPVWDYDVSMGWDPWRMAVPNVFYANRPHLSKSVEASWFHGLYQKPEFYERMVSLYREEMRPKLEALLEGGIEDYFSQVSTAANLNALRWLNRDPAKDAAWIQTYLVDRMAFLDSIWLEGQEYCMVTMDLNDGSNAVCFVLSPGDTIPVLPDLTGYENVLGWYNAETGEPVEVTQAFSEDTILTLQYQEPDSLWLPEEPEPKPETSVTRQTLVPLALLLVILAGVAWLDLKNTRN